MRSLGALLTKRLRNDAPVPYVGSRLSSTFAGTARGDRAAELATMGTVGTLYSIVNRTSNSTAQVNWRLWRKAKSGNKDDRTEVTSHLALDIWNKPNPWMPRQEFVETFQQHIDLTGEAWWVVARNPAMRSIPLELWPVRPDRMNPVPHPQKFLSGFVYTSPDGEKVPLELDEVIQLRMPNPMDPYRGLGPVQSILTDLDSVRYSAQWNRNFFVNSATPGGVIEVPTKLEDNDYIELRDRWREQHRGVAAAHRVAILEGGMKWVDRSFTNQDMQFVELRGVSREVIREAFGIAAFALGEVADVNRATAEASRVWFAEQITTPRLERIKGALNNDFLPLFGTAAEGLEFDFDDPVPPDAEARDRERTSKAAAAKTYIDAGFTGESVVEALELPEALVWEKPKPPPAPIAPMQPGQPEQQDPVEPPDGPQNLLRFWNATDDETERLVTAAMNAIRAGYETALKQLLGAWGHISAAQINALVDQIRKAADDGNLTALTKIKLDTDDAVDELTAAMVAIAAAGAQGVVDQAAAQGVNITAADVPEKQLRQLAAVIVALLAAGLTAAAISAALLHWGENASTVGVEVREHLDGLSDRALRDHLGGALHSAQQAGRGQAMRHADIQPTAFLASEINDDNRCQYCGTIDGRRFATLAAAEAEYPMGWYRNCLGGNRCRGSIVPIWEATT